MQGLSFETDISSDSADVRQAGKNLLTTAMRVQTPVLPQCLQAAARMADKRALLSNGLHKRNVGVLRAAKEPVLANPRSCGPLQQAAEFGARHFVGVTYSAMGKYPTPASAEQWQHCVTSLRLSRLQEDPLSTCPSCVIIGGIACEAQLMALSATKASAVLQELAAVAADLGLDWPRGGEQASICTTNNSCLKTYDLHLKLHACGTT